MRYLIFDELFKFARFMSTGIPGFDSGYLDITMHVPESCH
jgi:hypothetical protein